MEIDVTPSEVQVVVVEADNSQECDQLADQLTVNSSGDPLSDPLQIDEGVRTVASGRKGTIKHALRQQAKRRRKNTTIASGSSSTVPRIIVKPLPPQPQAPTCAAKNRMYLLPGN